MPWLRRHRENRRRQVKRRVVLRGRAVWRVLRVVALAAVVAGAAAGLPIAGYLGYQQVKQSGSFAPEKIEISGQHRVSREQVLEAAALSGESVLDLDTDAVAERIKRLAWVADATVTKKLPNEVTIAIVEREPAGLVSDAGLHVVDAEGAVIAPWDPSFELPAGAILSGAGLAASDEAARARVRQAFELAHAWQALGCAQRMPLSEVHWDEAIGFTLFAGRSELRLGLDRFEARLVRLEQVLGELERRGVAAEYVLVDLDRLDRVVVKARPTYVAAPPVSEESEEAKAADAKAKGKGSKASKESTKNAEAPKRARDDAPARPEPVEDHALADGDAAVGLEPLPDASGSSPASAIPALEDASPASSPEAEAPMPTPEPEPEPDADAPAPVSPEPIPLEPAPAERAPSAEPMPSAADEPEEAVSGEDSADESDPGDEDEF